MADKVTVNINNKDYKTNSSNMVLDVCRENDIFIPTLCEIEYIDEPFGGCRVCLVEIETDRGTEITTSCDTPVQNGMKITTDTEGVKKGRKMAIELLLSEHTGDCIAPCSRECPASLDVQGYLAHIANGRPKEAVKLIKEKTPLAVSLGRACFAPCEEECRREMVEDPIAIRHEKMYAAEVDIEEPWTPEISEETGKSIGVVGGGPAGLTAAYFLRLKGHYVKIYDMMPKLGGMMRYGIPNYRLPKDLLDKEIQWILDLGIEAETDVKMGGDFTLSELREKHDAVFIATGAWDSWMIPIEGKELPGVIGGIDFLVDYSLGKELSLGENVVVIGCGNTAMDVARTAKRLGKEVTIAYRRTIEQAPANEEEIEEAKEEGIKFVFLASPEKVCGCEEKGIEKVTCACMELGEPDESGRPKPIKIPDEEIDIEADSVILAIGQSPDLDLLEEQGLEKEKYTLKSNQKFQTNYEDVFTAGDVLMGASSIVEATGQGREAAYALDAYLKGDIENYEVPLDYTLPFSYVHTQEITEEDLLDWNKQTRTKIDKRGPDERIKDFDIIELGFDKEEAETEAERCLECGCLDRFQCLLRKYADRYGAEQYTYEGFKYEREKDDSHPNIVREPEKCILCGSCVRTSEEVHGEGVVQFAHRGFKTIVESAFGEALGNIDSKLVGDLADACPTGAFEEVLNNVKPGPFDTKIEGTTHCIGCGVACPADIHTVNGRVVKMTPAKDEVFKGHLCDIGKFETLPNKQDRPKLNETVFSRLKDMLSGREFDVIVSPSISKEEVKKLKNIVEQVGGQISTSIGNRNSTATLQDLIEASKIFVEEGVFNTSPILKMFVKRARDNGAKIITQKEAINDDVLAIVNENSDVNSDKTIIAHVGANAEGLISLLGNDSPSSYRDTVVIYGNKGVDLDDFEEKTVIHFTDETTDISEEADLIIPIRNWLEQGGTIINSFGDELKLNKVLDSDLPSNLEILDKLEEIVK